MNPWIYVYNDISHYERNEKAINKQYE